MNPSAPAVLLLAVLHAVGTAAPEPALRWVRTLGDPAFRHGSTITHALPLPDGRVLTTARDGTARFWDAEGRELRVERPDPAKDADVWNARLLPNGEVLLAVTGQPLRAYPLAGGDARPLTASAHSAFRISRHDANGLVAVATAGEQGGITLFDPAVTNQWRRIPAGVTMYDVQFTHDGARVIAGGDEKTLGIWPVAAAVPGDRAAEEAAGPDPLAGEGDDDDADAEAPADVKARVRAALDAALKAEKPALRRERKPVRKTAPAASLPMPADVYTIAPAPDRRRFLVVCDDSHLLLVQDGPALAELWRVELPGEAQSAAWSPDGSWAAVACSDHRLYRVNPADGALTALAELPPAEHWAVAFSADGNALLVSAGPLLCRFDAASGKRLFPPADTIVLTGLDGLVVEADGARAFTAAGTTVHEVDLATGGVKRRLGTAPDLDSLSLLPGGPLLLRGSPSALMEREGGRLIVKWADDARLLSGLPLWIKGGEALRAHDSEYQAWARGFDQSLSSLAFSADGARLAATTYQNLTVWNTRTGRRLIDLNLVEKRGDALRLDRLVFGPAGGPPLAAAGPDALVFWKSAAPAGPAPAADEVAGWVRDLGATSFAARRAAAERLEQAGEAALEALTRAAADEDDPEVSESAGELLARIQAALLPRDGFTRVPLDQQAWNARTLSATPVPGLFALARGGAKPVLALVREQGGKLVVVAEVPAAGRPDRIQVAPGPGGEILVYACNGNGTIDVYRLE